MIEVILFGLLAVADAVMIGWMIYVSTRRGEKCPGYSYKCPWCRHAEECLIIVGSKSRNDKEIREKHRKDNPITGAKKRRGG